MKIDWFTIIAQALNFLILVWLMKRFLYKPIRNAIDEREKRIAAELANADKIKITAQKESEELKQKNKDFDDQRAALLTKAQSEAQAERERLLDEARKAAVALSLKQQETLKNEAHNLNQSISLQIKQEVFSISRKVLTDLSGTSLEERIVDVFIRQLHDLTEEKKKLLIKAALAQTSVSPVLVRTSFNLPPTQRAATESAIKEIFGKDIQIRFDTAPDPISGIELTTNGQRVAWSIGDYLSQLEKGVDELIKGKDTLKPEVKAEPKSPNPPLNLGVSEHGT
jgi:F-type H+-transporting ATPase subunit b